MIADILYEPSRARVVPEEALARAPDFPAMLRVVRVDTRSRAHSVAPADDRRAITRARAISRAVRLGVKML